MPLFLALVASLLILLTTSPALATFHESVINEVMSGAAGDSNVQYVEIEMTAPFETLVGCTRLTAFSCDGSAQSVLMVVPSSVPNGGAGRTWLMASPNDTTFFAASGIHANFYWDNAASGDINPLCGMVCWGAPGVSINSGLGGNCQGGTPNWDASDPNQYTDCVAYGGYTGPRKTAPSYAGGPTSGNPTNLTAGDGTFSLTRVSQTNDNATDFSVACPTPTNNGPAGGMGSTGSFGPCTTPTTTLPPLVALCGPVPEPDSACKLADPATGAGKSLVQIKNDADDSKDAFKWKWNKGVATAVADFKMPTTATATYRVCIYDASADTQPLLEADIPNGGIVPSCGTQPCWSPSGTTGFKYKNKAGTPYGITAVKLKANGTGKAQIQVKGKGTKLDPPPTASLVPDVVVQFLIDDGATTECFKTTFPGSSAGSVKKQDATQFQATGP